MPRQITDTVLMVRPAKFGWNPQTAETNSFQSQPNFDPSGKAREQFEGLVELLKNQGVIVNVLEDSVEPEKPDAVFPNNWVSFHEDNQAAIFPMRAENRRIERRADAYEGRKVLDLTHFETENLFLEGTGSMVLDRVNRIAYASLSPRTAQTPLEHFCAAMHYYPLAFESLDRAGKPIYHTNTVLAIGQGFAVVCTEAITHPNRVIAELKIARHEVIEITRDQMEQYCANVLHLQGSWGPIIVMSSTAFRALGTDQLEALSRYGEVVHTELDVIEQAGGGSARCMIAEVF